MSSGKTSDHLHPSVVLVGCIAISIGLNAYLIPPASVIPTLIEEYAISKPTASLSNSMLFIAWVSVQIPSGLLIDRYDNRTIVVAAWGSVVLLTYLHFLGTRLGGGVGAVLVWTTGANIVSTVFRPNRRTLATSLFTASAPFGFFVGQFLTPIVAAAFSWQFALAAYGILSTVSVPLFLLSARRPIRSERLLGLGTFVSSLGNRSVLFVSFASFCTYLLFLFFNTWMPAYATEHLSVHISVAGALSSLLPLAGVLARPTGGYLSARRLGHRGVIAASFLFSVLFVVAIPLQGTSLGFAEGLVVVGFSTQLSVGIYYVDVADLADDRSSGTSLTVLMEMSTFGTLSSLVLEGWLIERFSWSAGFG